MIELDGHGRSLVDILRLQLHSILVRLSTCSSLWDESQCSVSSLLSRYPRHFLLSISLGSGGLSFTRLLLKGGAFRDGKHNWQQAAISNKTLGKRADGSRRSYNMARPPYLSLS